MLGVSVFALFILSLFLTDEKPAGERSLSGITRMLSDREYMKPVLTVFFAFIVFSSIMNFYSIRLKELSPGISELMIGAAYFGSLFGSLTAYLTPAFARITGSYKRTIMSAFVFQLLCTFVVCSPFSMVIICISFCLLRSIHSYKHESPPDF